MNRKKKNKFLIPIGEDDEKYFLLLNKYKEYIGGVYIGWPSAPSGRIVNNSRNFFDKIYSWCKDNDKVFDILFNMQTHDFKSGFDFEKVNIKKYSYKKTELTFSSILLFRENKFLNFKKNISVNYKINKVQQLFFLKNELKEINSVIIDRDINRDLGLVKEIIKELRRMDIYSDIIVNEGCMPYCPNKIDHNIFITLSAYSNQDVWMKKSKVICQSYYKKTSNILKSPFITKENLDKYDCRFYKIVGRRKPVGELDEILDYYICGKPVDIGFAFANINLKTGVKTNIFTKNFNKKILNCKNDCGRCNFCEFFLKNIKKINE